MRCLCRESDEEEDGPSAVAEAVRKTKDITSFFGKKSGTGGSENGRVQKKAVKKKSAGPAKLPACLSALGIKRATTIL